jgi:DNA polymerase-3 subunit epsilon
MSKALKFFWVDTETTGLDPVKHGIVQIAGILMVGGKEVEKFNLTCAPHPDDKIEDEALKVHGRSKEEIRGYQQPGEVYEALLKMFSKYVNKYDKTDKFYAAGKNVRFDLNFLNEFFRKNGKAHPKYNCLGDPFFFSWVHAATLEVETLAVLYELKKKGKIFSDYKLETICNEMGVDLSNAHDAMADIEASRSAAKIMWDAIQKAE